jgi:tetratricopeptide (TPR) repeat protein/DNA-binding winged helix-turn-helix (wHTH) protein
MRVLGRQIYRFDGIEVDPSRGCLRRGSEELEVRQKSLQLLLYLLEQRHRLVTKEELIEHVWEGMAVTDDSLVQLVIEIRRHLGDDPRRPRFIKTVPKVGYRFIAPVEEFPFELPAAIEVEHHASVEIEFEEEISDARERETEARPAAFIQSAQALKRRRNILLTAVASFLLIASASAFYLKQSQPRRARDTEVTLPRVPGKRTLVVMFFENRSSEAETDWLREGLADMLITDLSRSAKFSVLGRQQLHLLLERGGYSAAREIRQDEALDVARGISADAVALGSFARVGAKTRLDVQLYDTRTGAMLAAESGLADEPAQVLTQIDILALKLAAHLGDAPAAHDTKASLSDVMTDNLEAYRYYSLGVEKAQAMNNAEAIALLEKAVALDPQFAMAYARIGYAYAVTWSFPDKAKPYLEKAFQLSPRLTEKDRLYIAAWYAIANLDYAGAIKSFREIVARYPLEIEAYLRLARLLRGEGRYEEAIEAAKQALAVDAGSADLYNVLGMTYSELGRHDEALTMFRRYVELAPDEPNAHDSLGMGYQWAGRYAEAVQEYERALQLNPNFDIAIIHLGNVYFQQGRYREALAQYHHYIEVVSSDTESVRGYNSIALVHLKRGELDEAWRAAGKSWGSLHNSESYILVALAKGDLPTVAKAEEQYLTQRVYDRGARASERAPFYVRGCFDLKQGRAAEAVENFKEALRQRPLIWNIDSYEDCLANAYLELGRFDEAIAEYERILRLNPNYPLAQYHLAQALEREGQEAQAQSAYEHFLQTWKDADVDVTEVVGAHKRLAK